MTVLTNRARVLETLRLTSIPLDDDELARRCEIAPRQTVNQICRDLAPAGLVLRSRGAEGKIVNRLVQPALPRPRQMPGGRFAPLTTTTASQAAGPPPVIADVDARSGASSATLDEAAAIAALISIFEFTGGSPPRSRIAGLEQAIVGADVDQITGLLNREMISDCTLAAGLLIKSLAGEINVLIHAVGIVLSLPHILVQGEHVLSASLGAGTGGKQHDLETTHRIAEFKFTQWRGRDSVRQRELFADFVNLAEHDTGKLRTLYITGSRPEQFLRTSNRQITSVCERRPEILARIQHTHGLRYRTVSEYCSARGDQVEIVNLETLLSAYKADAG